MALPPEAASAFAGLKSAVFVMMSGFVVIAALVHLPKESKIIGALGALVVLWLLHKLL